MLQSYIQWTLALTQHCLLCQSCQGGRVAADFCFDWTSQQLMQATRDVSKVTSMFRILGVLWAEVETFFQCASVTTSRVKQVPLPSLFLKHSKPEQSSINVREINKIIIMTVKVTISDHPDENEQTHLNTDHCSARRTAFSKPISFSMVNIWDSVEIDGRNSWTYGNVAIWLFNSPPPEKAKQRWYARPVFYKKLYWY